MVGNRVRVSFCTVTYNNKNKIQDLVENIQSLENEEFGSEIFIVDNGSTDGTVRIAQKLEKQFENVHVVLPPENRGFGAGNNAVLPLINSDYHVMINPDVRIESTNQVQSMIDFMESHQSVGLLSPKILNIDGTVQKLYKHNPTVLDLAVRFFSPKLLEKRQAWFVHEDTGYSEQGFIEYASGAFMFMRTSTFKQIRGFDERYFMYMEDADITRKVNSVSESVFFPDATVTHEWQRESHKRIKFMWMTIVSMIKYFNKWGWKFF